MIEVSDVLLGLIGYFSAIFLKPIVLVARDKIVWIYLNECVLTTLLDKHIEEFALKTAIYEQHFSGRIGFNCSRYFAQEADDEEPIEISKAQADDFNSRQAKIFARIQFLGIQIGKQSSHFDSLIRHYDQDKKNIIDDFVELNLKRYRAVWSDKTTLIGLYKKNQLDGRVIDTQNIFPFALGWHPSITKSAERGLSQ